MHPSLSYRVRAHLWLSLILIASQCFACSFHIPLAREAGTTLPRLHAQRPAGPALLGLLPHHDGLGWDITAQQPVIQEWTMTTTETWRVLKEAPRSWNLPMNLLGGALCPVAAVLSGIYSLFEPEEPAYVLPTKVCSALFGYRWQETLVHEPLDPQYTYTENAMIPIDTGTLSLHEDHSTAPLLTLPISHTTPMPLALRVSTISHTLTTQHITPSATTPLLTLTTPDGISTSVNLPVTLTQILTIPIHPITTTHRPWSKAVRLRVMLNAPVEDHPLLLSYAHAIEDQLSSNPEITLIPSSHTQTEVSDSLATLHTHAYADDRLPRPGKHHAPTFLLVLATIDTVTPHHITATLFDLETSHIVVKDIHPHPTTPQHLAHRLANTLHDAIERTEP